MIFQRSITQRNLDAKPNYGPSKKRVTQGTGYLYLIQLAVSRDLDSQSYVASNAEEPPLASRGNSSNHHNFSCVNELVIYSAQRLYRH